MFHKKLLLFSIIGLLLCLVSSAPQLGGGIQKCFDQQCPERTTGCKKVTKTSEDKQTMDETIICMDAQDYELQRTTHKSPNPYGPNTHYESTSFTGSYTFSSGGNLNPIHINHNNFIGNSDKDVELI